MSAATKLVKLNNGLVIPKLGLGTWQQTDTELLKGLIKDAIKIGYRHIDTATVYKNETAIGEALQEVFADETGAYTNGSGPNGKIVREDIWVTSKLQPRDQGYDNTIAAVNSSLKKLNLNYIDMYLIHWPGVGGCDPQDPKQIEIRKQSWLALEKLVQEKKLRCIGVSNYQIKHLEEMNGYATIKPVINQCEFHPLLFTKDLLDYCGANGIQFQAYSSLGEGNLVNGKHNIEAVEDIAQKLKLSPAQILLAWGLQHNAIVLPKSSSKQRLIANFESQFAEIPEEDMKKIDAVSKSKTVRFCWNPTTVI
ncbi:Prostaglandin F synthase [Zancudomyces culisetae]|uniref:Prostaglandin F synthase n=1 Tax=Zancudomyces culisetae TaxID=1213189 RepID=A0A1R1PVI0_ZANCU|nr:Prostaglandin F synthase [Zancudomyces culisetae]|eukprot:OMH84970.1 Prostaglandin F synthase [Zancudomyces culisetae]